MRTGLGFDKKQEWLDTGVRFEARPLGSALLAFISGDAGHPLLEADWEKEPSEPLRALLCQAVEAVLTEGEKMPLERLWAFYNIHPEVEEHRIPLAAERRFHRSGQGIDTRVLLVSERLDPLLFAALEQMAEEGITVRRCACCGGWFVPYSSRAIYCDRLVGESGRSCKELAAREKYEKKIADDEGRALFQRRSKAYAMRVRRDPERFSLEEYQAWRDYGEMAVKAYNEGKLTLELLRLVLQLPEV